MLVARDCSISSPTQQCKYYSYSARLRVLKRLKKFLLLSLLMNLKEVDMNVELER